MAARLPDIVQTDFGGGQINFALKRRDNLEFVKTGARQMVNWRIEAGGTLLQRPAKRPVFPTPGGRNEYVRMGANAEFILNFGNDPATGQGVVTINNLAGTSQAQYQSADYIWTPTTINQISWCVALFDIVICYPGMQPQIVRWSPANLTWTFLPYSFRVIDFQSQEPFYRFSVPGATMSYDSTSGTANLICSVPYFTTEMVGELLSIVGCQVTILNVINPQQAIVQIAYRLPDNVNIAVTDTRPFQPGMTVELRDQDLKFEIGTVAPPQFDYGLGELNEIVGTMLSDLVCDFTQFTYDPSNPDVLVSELGASTIFGYPFAHAPGQPTVQWTEEFMCAQRGWPSACAYTAGRLCFYGFPQMQEAILWSAVGADDVCWVDPVAATRQPEAGTEPDSAILEFESSRPKIVSVMEWGDVFVFSDRGIFFVPVSQANPLSPGNVEFRRFSNDGVSIIRPVSTQDAIVYINAGLNRCSVVRATGSLTRPYISDDVSESHAPLFTGPQSLAIATGDGPYPERYVYVTNADGTIVVGKFTQQRTLIGWVPWTSVGLCTWVCNAGPKVWFTSLYASALGHNYLLEIEDPLYYLDGMVFLNQPAAGMANPGYGPLWHLAGMTVQVVDQQGFAPRPDNIPNGCVDWGDRQVDGNGNLILRPEDGQWSGSATVYAGLWSPPVYEPFIFPPQEGRSAPGQRGKRRKLQRAVVSVEHSNGFTFGKKTIPPFNWLEDPTVAQGDPPFPLPPSIEWRRDFIGATGPDPNWK